MLSEGDVFAQIELFQGGPNSEGRGEGGSRVIFKQYYVAHMKRGAYPLPTGAVLSEWSE